MMPGHVPANTSVRATAMHLLVGAGNRASMNQANPTNVTQMTMERTVGINMAEGYSYSPRFCNGPQPRDRIQ